MPSIKKWNLFIYFVIFMVLSTAGKAVKLVTDYWWFQELGFTEIFTKTLSAQLALGIGAAVLAWAVLLLNWRSARRARRKPFIIFGPEVSVAGPFQQLGEIGPLVDALMLFAILAGGVLIGSWSAGHWESTLKFFHASSFGWNDPVFGRDAGFYVFQVPFLKFLYHYALTVTVLSMLVSVAMHAAGRLIVIVPGGFEAAPAVKTHFAVLGGCLALLVAFHFQFAMFDLLHFQREIAPGAGYSQLNAFLPGLKVLRVVAVLAALLLWASPWFADARILFGAILLLVGGTILARVYAQVVQKFEVAPNELVREEPFIRLGIENTRRAYGLDGAQELEFDPQENLDAAALQRNHLTLNNIRLWEHRPLRTTYSQLQEIRTYYDFLDADNDRYVVDGEYRQVMLSMRELVPESLPSRIWINEHLTYTHGYGLCLGPVNQISAEGLPEFFIKDIPPKSSTNIRVTRPEIYYGESRTKYAITNTLAKEFDYPSGDENVYSDYAGKGGVPAGGLLRRILFAVRFGELKILFSKDITPGSRFLYYRSVRERMDQCAPFLRFDNDPYVVISKEGRLFWMVDGYSITDRYPYSENVQGLNYIRNSVKATIDAYDGAVTLYVADPSDPIVKTYSGIFPGIFQPLDAMPEDLRSHIRYPQTLLDIQARIFAVYHMTDPQIFYNKEDLWKIPLRTAGGRSEVMQPYYTIMKLAGVGNREEFILMVPFTPSNKENMIAWMAARCDAPNYGKLLVYNFPKQKLVYGPQQIESRIDQDADISKQLTLWNQGGSRVERGSLLVIPVDQSLLYVQPLYLEASGGGLPELKRVIAAYGNSIAMEENLELCLDRIFGGGGRRPRAAGSAAASGADDLSGLAREARDRFEKAQAAARRGDWSSFGDEMQAVRRILEKLAGKR